VIDEDVTATGRVEMRCGFDAQVKRNAGFIIFSSQSLL